jgi:hypothetical protein
MKPKVKLVGRDGNALAILGACQNAAKKAKWTPEQITEWQNKAMSGNYDNLLCVCMEYFDVR